MKKFASILLSMLMATGAIAAASAETYTGTAQGIGEVSVTLTVEDGKITAAEVVGESETKGIGYEPCADGTFADAIVAAQGVDFDSISGATVTSNAVKDAAKKAMAAAGLIEAEDTTVTDTECDVVIVGAGGAGMTAALQAVDSGVNSVIIVEKGGSTGGNTSRATGGMNAAKTVYQDENEWSDATTTAVEKAIATAEEKYADGDKISNLTATVKEQFEAYKANPEGYFDSVELFALDTIIGGKGLNNFDLVMTLTGNSAEAIDWLATKNAHLTNVGSFGGASVKRIHRATTEDGKTTPVGAYLVKVLTADVEAEDKIDLRTNTAATEIVMEDGKAVGVKVKSENGEYTIRAKAVILASGGYGANDALVPDEYKKFVYAGHAGATGDAIKMVEGLDADLINMDLVNTQPNSMILPSGLGQYCNPGVAGAYKAGAYMVNQNGERFFNESANAWDLMQAMKQNEAQYLIMDQTAFDNFNAGMTNSKIYTMEDVEKWLSDDYDGQPVMKQGATLAELCEKLNLPADAVEVSAKAFNDCAAAQTADAFGRTPAAAQSEEGPFYALQMHIRYYASLGGLHINDSMQVLNTKQEAIPGLYAAGEVVGGLEGDVYMGATLFGWAIASGYDAANAVNAVIAQ